VGFGTEFVRNYAADAADAADAVVAVVGVHEMRIVELLSVAVAIESLCRPHEDSTAMTAFLDCWELWYSGTKGFGLFL